MFGFASQHLNLLQENLFNVKNYTFNTRFFYIICFGKEFSEDLFKRFIKLEKGDFVSYNIN